MTESCRKEREMAQSISPFTPSRCVKLRATSMTTTAVAASGLSMRTAKSRQNPGAHGSTSCARWIDVNCRDPWLSSNSCNTAGPIMPSGLCYAQWKKKRMRRFKMKHRKMRQRSKLA